MLSVLSIDAQPFQWGVVIGASLVSAVWDVGWRRIPNALTGPVFLGGLVWSLWTGGLSGLGLSITASALLALPFVVLFVVVGGGAGDAKLMGAIGAWLGICSGIVVLFTTVLSGLLLAAGFALARKQFRVVARSVLLMILHRLFGLPSPGTLTQPLLSEGGGHSSQTMPYGVAIFVGVCTAVGGVLIWRAAN